MDFKKRDGAARRKRGRQTDRQREREREREREGVHREDLNSGLYGVCPLETNHGPGRPQPP